MELRCRLGRALGSSEVCEAGLLSTQGEIPCLGRRVEVNLALPGGFSLPAASRAGR